MTLLFALTDIH